MDLYKKRNHEALGSHYLRHIDAMTAEGLHSKSSIAGELAARDAEIEKLRKDAGRYLWLLGNYLRFNVCEQALKFGSLDAAIDAAAAEEVKGGE